jgi:hypothetical protein
MHDGKRQRRHVSYGWLVFLVIAAAEVAVVYLIVTHVPGF